MSWIIVIFYWTKCAVGTCTSGVKVTLGFRPNYIAVLTTGSVSRTADFYLNGSTGYIYHGNGGTGGTTNDFTLYDDGFTCSRYGGTYLAIMWE